MVMQLQLWGEHAQRANRSSRSRSRSRSPRCGDDARNPAEARVETAAGMAWYGDVKSQGRRRSRSRGAVARTVSRRLNISCVRASSGCGVCCVIGRTAMASIVRYGQAGVRQSRQVTHLALAPCCSMQDARPGIGPGTCVHAVAQGKCPTARPIPRSSLVSSERHNVRDNTRAVCGVRMSMHAGVSLMVAACHNKLYYKMVPADMLYS